jgi:hypothetical protein
MWQELARSCLQWCRVSERVEAYDDGVVEFGPVRRELFSPSFLSYAVDQSSEVVDEKTRIVPEARAVCAP